MLKTDFIFFDIYLSEFVNKKNNILEINTDKGYTTEWFLNYLCNDKDSLIISVDTWNKSKKYKNLNITINEKIFDENISKTGRSDQVKKMKMSNSEAINIITDNKKTDKIFNIIYIDCSYFDEKLILICIHSLDLLEDDGVMILDDYNWDNINKEFYKTNITIKTFLYKFESKIKILNKKYQIIIKKKNININNKNKEYYNLINDIEKYKMCNIWQNIWNNIDNNFKIDYDLILSNKPSEYLSKYGSNEKYKKLINSYYEKESFAFKNFLEFQLNRFLEGTTKFNSIYDDFSKQINKEIIKHNYYPFDVIKKTILFIGNSLEVGIFETVMTLINKKILIHQNIKSLYIINFTYWDWNNKDIQNTIDDNTSLGGATIENYFKKKLKIDDILIKNIKSSLFNVIELKDIVEKISVKQDIIIISLFTKNLLAKEKYDNEKYYLLQFLYSIVFILSIGKINSNGVIYTFSLFTDISIELLWLLKKYYKNIYLTCNMTTNMVNRLVKIYICDFNGIDNKELKQLYDILEEIQLYNVNHDDYDSGNYKYISKILKIDKTQKEYLDFEKKIINFNLELIELMTKNRKLIDNIFLFLENKKISVIMKNKLKKKIKEKQIIVFLSWVLKRIT